MLRSFDYAAFAALFAFAGDRPEDFDGSPPGRSSGRPGPRPPSSRSTWRPPPGAPFLPADPAQSRAAAGAFTLDKALYELLYELNNRPDWVRIPLQGIARPDRRRAAGRRRAAAAEPRAAASGRSRRA